MPEGVAHTVAALNKWEFWFEALVEKPNMIKRFQMLFKVLTGIIVGVLWRMGRLFHVELPTEKH